MMSQSRKKLLLSLLIAVPWMSLAAIAVLWWTRILVTDPQFAIRHGSMEMALRALLEPRPYEEDWERRIRQSHPRDAAALRDILKSDRDVFRWVAASALGTMKDTRAVDDLIRLLQTDESFQVRYTAARALAEIGDERAVGPLMAAMADPDTTVRNVAVDSLGAMNATQAVSQIEAFSKKYEYPSAQYSAEQALRLLRGSHNHATKSNVPPALQR